MATGGHEVAEPTPRRRLAAELRRLRDLAGISGRDLAPVIGISQSTLSRIENGAIVPSMPQVTKWATAVGVSGEAELALRRLTEAAHSPAIDSREHALETRAHLQDDVREREEAARLVRNFQPFLIPGLLQTAEYARRVFSNYQKPYAPEDLAAAVASRLHRQLVLYNPEKRFEFLITEAALRYRPGPHRMLLGQLDRLASIETLDNVTFGLIPQDVEATATIPHGFVIYENTDHTLAATETIAGNLIALAPEVIELHQQRWDSLCGMALFDDAARGFLHKVRTEVLRAARD
ncbi:helix-turn-helix domain-containing protein [Nocardia blacklockiae]|uniref:helix-turn-helix domain-containing protein n=1 Tax=Nocardia blacklockiae TaxID=480036 RepID=UPI0018949E6A|nr:helix-turn-helix transcriptional regulator [Nocardia blacklockiae]MBF6175695.1 helix-turn-helix domain-containing protein [Nocardia blacklockiae]